MIKVVCVGKIKEKYLELAMLEYLKRLSKYTKVDIIEVMDDSSDKALKLEGERILKHIRDNEYVITLDIEGKMLNSLEFAQKMNQTLINNSNITFIIGGSYGLDLMVKERSNYALSFSKMTFPHQLFRVVLLEQIYRAFKILNNESYHK